MDDDALSIGKIWSVNYFFYNKQLKKLAFFACWIKSKIRGRVTDEGEEMDRFLPICFGAKPLSCPLCHEHALVASKLFYRFPSTAAPPRLRVALRIYRHRAFLTPMPSLLLHPYLLHPAPVPAFFSDGSEMEFDMEYPD